MLHAAPVLCQLTRLKKPAMTTRVSSGLMNRTTSHLVTWSSATIATTMSATHCMGVPRVLLLSLLRLATLFFCGLGEHRPLHDGSAGVFFDRGLALYTKPRERHRFQPRLHNGLFAIAT